MRILMISPQFHPLVGGYERSAARLSQALACLGHEVTVLAERQSRSWPAEEHLEGFQIHRYPVLHRPGWHTLSGVIALGSFLLRRGRSYQVWHVHQYGTSAAMAAILGGLLRRPVLLKLTSSGPQGIGVVAQGGLLGMARVWALRRIAACAAVSKETAEEAQAFGIPQERIFRLANGVDCSRFSPRPEPAGGDPERRAGTGGTALWVGRLSAEKGLDLLLDAWAIASPQLPAWRLRIVGDGPLMKELAARQGREPMGGTIDFLGHRAEVLDEYLSADLFLLSSYREGLSNTTLEAMACGLPVVATAVSGMEELLQGPEAGVIVPIGDATAMAGALVRLARDPERRHDLGSCARAKVVARYDLPKVAREYEALYRRLAGQS